MCGLLFEYDVRLSAKMYFTKSYMNIRTIEKTALESQFLAFGAVIFYIFLTLKYTEIQEKTGKMLGKCKAGKVRYNRYFQAFKKCDIMQNH